MRIRDLPIGTKLLNKYSQELVVVTEVRNIGGQQVAIAVRTVVVTNPHEWESFPANLFALEP